ncbi:hypothetical protein [Paenibacillus alvei]
MGISSAIMAKLNTNEFVSFRSD